MKCPICKQVLLKKAIINNNIEINYCPSCSGTWLEKGQIDMIIENAISSANT